MTLQESYSSIKQGFEYLRAIVAGGDIVMKPEKVEAQLQILALDLSEAAMLAAEVRLNMPEPGKKSKYGNGDGQTALYKQSEELSSLVKTLQYNVRMILDARKIL